MEDHEVVVVKKKWSVGKIIAVVLALAALCVLAAKLYQKFSRKKKDDLLEDDEVLDDDALCEDMTEEAEVLEVPADAVIANIADMEEIPAE